MESKTRFETLGGNMQIEVSDDCRFGEDALLLAEFTNVRSSDKICDLGTGCGILPLLWCRDHPGLFVQALEIQPEAAAMARFSVNRCGLSDSIAIHTADLRNWREVIPPGSQDIVTMNPPYFPAGTGNVSKSKAARIARHEGIGCTLGDAADAAYGLLRSGGRFCLCHRPERLCDVVIVLRNAGLEPKRMQLVQIRCDTPPWLLLCEARKGAKPGLTVLPPLIQKNTDSNQSVK